MSILSLKNLKGAALFEPQILAYPDSEGEARYIRMLKGAERTIYNGIGIQPGVSSKVFGLSSDIWSELITLMCSDPSRKNGPFSFDNYKYIVSNVDGAECVVDATDKDIEGDINRFNQFVKNHNANVLDTEAYGLKIIIKDTCDNDSTMIMIIDFDISNSLYRLYTGEVISDETTGDSRIIIGAKPVRAKPSLSEFIQGFDFEYEIEATKKMIVSGYYKGLYSCDKSPVSVREVLDILGHCRSKIYYDNDTQMVEGTSIREDIDDTIPRFLNSFGIPFSSLKKISYLRKSIRSGFLTIDDLLLIFSKEIFLDGSNVGGRTIAEILNISYSSNSDRKVLKEELK